MKLYASVTSERATKSQGGNTFLEIQIQAEKLNGIPTRANVYRFILTIEGNELNASLLDYSTGEVMELTRGEKQKDERRCPRGCARGYCSDNCAGLSAI